MTEEEKSNQPWKVNVPLRVPYQIPDTNRVVSSVTVGVKHGRIGDEDKSWVSVSFGNEDLFPMETLGYGFNGTEFTELGTDNVASGEIINQIRTKFTSEPELMKELNEELKK